jgi:hypothetical protein
MFTLSRILDGDRIEENMFIKGKKQSKQVAGNNTGLISKRFFGAFTRNK